MDAASDRVTHTVRPGTVGDLKALTTFFVKAYGPRTVFRDEAFLRWWLYEDGNDLNNLLAVAPDGTISGHYGWMPTTLVGKGMSYAHAWGVNAFTLPEARGDGIGSALVQAFTRVRPTVGVLGFTDDVAAFYNANGFNMFGGELYCRHVLPLSHQIRELLELVGTVDHPSADDLLRPSRPRTTPRCETTQPSSWVDEPVESLASYLTPLRSQRWLAWRYAADSRLRYTLYAHESAALGRALVAFRRIPLIPTQHCITKVVDLYGDVPAAIALLELVCSLAYEAGVLYADFWSFGGPYSDGLEDLGFRRYEGQEVTVLPALTDPVSCRPNTEHAGVFEQSPGKVATLAPDDVYFTSALADRDRPARA